MTKTAKGSPSPQAPVDTPVDAPVATDGGAKPKKVPQRGVRRRVLGEGEGDYCIYEIAGPESQFPRGALIPVPSVPRFADTGKALQWIRTESGDLLAGKQVMIFRACEVLSLRVQQKPTVVIEAKPKVAVTKPGAVEKSDG